MMKELNGLHNGLNHHNHTTPNGAGLAQQLEEDSGKTRYSKEELEEFQLIILAKLDKARKDLKMYRFTSPTGNDHDVSDTSPTFKVLEEGSEVNSKDENSKLAARLDKFITVLENALIRIENGSYGICRITGKLIAKHRLRLVPHATLSVEGKEIEEKQNQIMSKKQRGVGVLPRQIK